MTNTLIELNDRHGHLVGDSVLREVVQRLRNNSRLYDSVGRYGGEEFLVVMPNTQPQNALNQAERLRHCVSNTVMEIPSGRIAVSVSGGIAVGTTEGPAQMESLLKAADDALYRAKEMGRDRVEAAWENPIASGEPITVMPTAADSGSHTP